MVNKISLVVPYSKEYRFAKIFPFGSFVTEEKNYNILDVSVKERSTPK